MRSPKLVLLAVVGLAVLVGTLLCVREYHPRLNSYPRQEPWTGEVIAHLKSKGVPVQQMALIYHCKSGSGTDFYLEDAARPIHIDNCGKGDPADAKITTTQDGSRFTISRGSLRIAMEGRSATDPGAVQILHAFESLPKWSAEPPRP